MVDAWADADDVTTYTGETAVSDAELIRAQDLIELAAGVTFDATIESPRNLRCLNRAVAYQTAWMRYHPDLYLNVDVDSIGQDGHSHTPAHENAALYAPLATRWLRRLSWASKPLRVRGRYGTSDSNDGPRDSAVADDNRQWSPM
jgi:hypothetical protein